MRRVTILVTALFILCITTAAFPPAVPHLGADSHQQNVEEFEEELSLIEKELNVLEQRVDNLMEDLVDPKITSFSLFFSTKTAETGIPLSLEVRLNNQPLVTREMSETDRLILLRGGAVEVYSGITEPMEHTIDLRCFIQDSTGKSGEVGSAKAVFKFDPRRASANFIEVTLSRGQERKTESFSLTAKHWSKEP